MRYLIKTILFSLILSALLYPGLDKLYLYRETIKFEDFVMAPMGFLGENQTILSNYDRFARYGTNYRELDLVVNRDLFIGIKDEFLFHERWVNLEEERSRVFLERWKQLDAIYKKLKNGEYSLIVYGPLESTLDSFWLVQFNQIYRERILDKENYENLDDYCELFLPTTEHGCNECQGQMRVFFKENKTCEDIIPRVSDYYANNFYKICELNQLTANIGLRTMLLGNGLIVNAKCNGGGNLLERYNDKNFRFIDLLSIFFLSILILIVNKYPLKNKKKLLPLFQVLITLIFLLLINVNSKYITNYNLNETGYWDHAVYEFYNSLNLEYYSPSDNEPINIYKLDIPNFLVNFPRYTTSNITIREDLKEPSYYVEHS